jgi:hypothetical protein
MGLTAFLSLQSKSCNGFVSPLKSHHSRPGLKPVTLGRIASTVTITLSRTTSLVKQYHLVATVVGVVRGGDSSSDSFSACQRAFSSKCSSRSCRGVRRECLDIPGSQWIEPWARNLSHDCHRFFTVGEAIIIHTTVPILSRVTTIKSILFAVDNILRLREKEGQGTGHSVLPRWHQQIGVPVWYVYQCARNLRENVTLVRSTVLSV